MLHSFLLLGKFLFYLTVITVVIAIIAILASMLLPALSKARAAAQSIKCTSNLKQCGLGLHMYAGDYDDYLPWYIRWGTTHNISGGVFWYEAILPYVGGPDAYPADYATNFTVPGVLICPSRGAGSANQKLGDFLPSNYAYNARMGDIRQTHAAYVARTLSGCKKPSLAVIIADGKNMAFEVIKSNWNGEWGFLQAHSPYDNMVHIDGHVEKDIIKNTPDADWNAKFLHEAW